MRPRIFLKPFKLSSDGLRSVVLRMKSFCRQSLIAFISGFVMLLSMGQAQAWSTNIAPPTQGQAESICPSENLDPWASGSTEINPGAWANFRRSGTGWQFIYNDLRTQMKAVYFTFSAQGKPTWLATEMTAFQSDGTWRAPFYKYTATAAPVIRGSVGIYFFPNDATRLALSWSWDQLAVHGDLDQIECLRDFNRGGPGDFGGGSTTSTPPPETPAAPSFPVNGPNTIFSGFWNASGATNDVPGTMVAIHQNWAGPSPARFTEVHTLATFDAVGDPVWLTAQKPIDPINSDPFTLPPWGDLSIETFIVIPNKNIYMHGVPINDCLMWQSPPLEGDFRCVAPAKVGDYVRSYTQTAGVGGKLGTARFTFTANPPGALAAPFNWPNTPQPLASSYFWPGTSAQTIKKITSSDGIIINRLAYMVGNGSNIYDEFWVSWNLSNPSTPAGTTAWRHDLNTGVYTRIGSASNGLNGYVRDPLPEGSRVQYELWTGTPPSAGSQLLYRTPEARVYGVEHQWDSGDGQAAIPPQPLGFQNPTLDAGSDAVGAVAGQFHVDEMGHAGYQIPLVVPAGRGGLTPQLAVSYNSSAGDGYLGTGMSLNGVSSISACRAGAEFYGDGAQFNPTPTEFCLDGQRLLLVSGTHRLLNARYKKEIDDMTLVVITGVDVLPTLNNMQALKFTAFGKDGSIRQFGGESGTTTTRNSAQPSVFNAIAWQQTSLADAMGNLIIYQYSPYNFNGERYLTGISYAGGQITFNYGGPSRTDISYSTLGPAQRSTLMRSISVRGASGGELRYYTWTYGTSMLESGNPNDARYRITDIKECANSAQAVCYPATSFLWKDQNLFMQSTASTGTFFDADVTSLKAGDFDGDGRMDMVFMADSEFGNSQPKQLHVAYSRPTSAGLGFTAPITLPGAMPDAYNDGAMWEVIDLNGDGRDDILYAWRDEATHVLTWFSMLAQCNPGCSFASPVPYISMPDIYVSGSILLPPGDEKAASIQKDGDVIYYVKDPGSSLVADVNGDGLADLLVRASDGQMRVVLRSSATSFGSPMLATFYDVDGATPCTNFIQDLDRNAEAHSQAIDADGDGRADFRAVVDGIGGSFNCAGAVVPTVPAAPESQTPYHQETFVSRGVFNTSAGSVFHFQRVNFFNDITVSAGSHASANAKLRATDLNADGLVDLLYLDSDNHWRYQINGAWTAGCLGGCQLSSHESDVQLIDFDGDGKLDFWFPNSSDKYDIYLWKGSSYASSPVSSNYAVGSASVFRLPVDLDGDGQVDNLSLTMGGHDWKASRSIQHHQARGVIGKITDGLGAATSITYAPMTFSSVYRRDFNGPSLNSGQLSAVFDVAGPNFLVSYVSSSAPTYNNGSDQAVVQYSYAGMKVQAGGRGSLGFRRMSTIDTQTGIEVDTWFNQAFPLTGTPNRTLTRQLTSLPVDVCLSTPDAPGCMVYSACPGGLGTDCDSDLFQMTNSSVLKEALDQWSTNSFENVMPIGGDTSGASPSLKSGEVILPPSYYTGPVILVKSFSSTENFDPANGFVYPGNPTHWDSTTLPAGDFDEFGNPKSSSVVQGGGGTSITTDSVFNYENTASYSPGNIVWRLGRLQWSRVKTTRSPAQDGSVSLRQSSFTYETHGLLESERVDGMTGTFPNGLIVDPAAKGVSTYYGYDAYGNRVSTRTCSSSLGSGTCKSATASTSQFHTAAGSTSVIRYSLTGYDSLGRFADSTTEVFSNGGDLAREVQVSTVTQRNEGGDPLEMTSANGMSSKIRYGALGRKRFTYSSTGSSSRSDWALCNTSSCPTVMGLALSYVMTTTTSGAPTSKVFYDRIGRPAISTQQGFGAGEWISTITFYDERGNVAKQSNPFFAQNSAAGAATAASGSSILWTDTHYDSLNRPINVSAPGAGTTMVTYSGLLKTTTLPANNNGLAQTVKEVRNGAGEVVSTEDAYGLVTSFSFDAAGNQTRVEQGGRYTDMVYDSLGRKISMTDPDMGAWSYVVNDAGETIRQVSPRGTCTDSRYDGRGRAWQRIDYSNAACTQPEAQANWQFDTASYGIGALASEDSSVNGVQRLKRTIAYDSLGRAASVTTLIDGKSYVESSTYDQYGRGYQGFFSTSGINQTGEVVQYNGQGYQYRVRSAFTAAPSNPSSNLGLIYNEVTAMNARGQVTDEIRMAGAHVQTEREYDVNTGRLKRILTGGGYLQDLSYDYDALGNVKYRQDTTDLAHTLREDFTYDKLQRLLTSTVKQNGSVTSNQDLSFTSDGNINTKTGVGTYTYGTKPTQCNSVSGSVTPGPHAVSSAGSGPGTTSYCYDANGNLLRSFAGAGSDKSLTWTAYDLTATISSTLANSKVGFDYGPNRERIRRLDYAYALATAAETLTHFVGSAEVRWSASGTNPSAFQEVRRYVGGVIIVQRGTGSSKTIRREYLLTDAQGSTYAVLDDYGMPINASARMSFDPFGKRRASADWKTPAPWSVALGSELKDTTRHGYTGHEQVDAVGIIHMGGRIYDPNLGRFLQADPFIQAPGNSQSLNRYTYVFNNPMAWTDPTGYWGAREQAGLRTVAAIVIACFTGYYAGVAMSAGGATAASNAAMISFAGGFAAGAVQSGNLRGAVIGGISSLAFFGVAKAFPVKGMNLGTGEGMAAYSKLALASGVTGGIMAEVQGGRFGNGFISAGASAFLSPIPEAATSNPAGQMVVTAVIGGTISRISGGKFANGAITGSFQFAMGRGLARFGDDGLVTGSTAAGDLDPASVPSQISIEASGFPTRDDAAIDAGAKYGPIGVANSQEVELGFVYDASSKSWGYLTPGWGPPGSTRIDTTALTAAYNAFLSPRGQFLGGWMHGHWDAQLNFSSTDFDSVWKKNYSVHMVNRAGQVRKLNYGHLREGLSNMSGSTFRKELSGLKQFYKEVGLPGDAL